jgi:hypothetical protein
LQLAPDSLARNLFTIILALLPQFVLLPYPLFGLGGCLFLRHAPFVFAHKDGPKNGLGCFFF